MTQDSKDITRLLQEAGAGSDDAVAELVPLIYDELRRLAHAQRRRWRGNETMSTTALVHEAYLKVLEQTGAEWLSREHFFAVASTAMRHILVNYAEKQQALKRGGGADHVPLEENSASIQPDTELILAVDQSLDKLREMSADMVKVVEYRFFAGFTVEEVAELLDVSPRTVKRQWRRARAWLLDTLSDHPKRDALPS